MLSEDFNAKYKKESHQIALFLVVVAIIASIIGFICNPSTDQQQTHPESPRGEKDAVLLNKS